MENIKEATYANSLIDEKTDVVLKVYINGVKVLLTNLVTWNDVRLCLDMREVLFNETAYRIECFQYGFVNKDLIWADLYLD